LRPRSDADLAFEPHEIVDVQGELWECRFDEVSDCPYYTNSSSGMSTYARPTSADEIWEMEEKAREVERRKAAEAEKEKWEESWDVLAEVSYWIHADRPEEIVWECPRGVKPSGRGKPKDRDVLKTLQAEYYGGGGGEGGEGGGGGEWGSLLTEKDAEDIVKNEYAKAERKRAVKAAGGKKLWGKMAWKDRLDALKTQRAADKEQARQEKMAQHPGFYDDQGYWYTYAYDEYNGYWDEDGNYYYGETTVAEDERLEAEAKEKEKEIKEQEKEPEVVEVNGGYGIAYNRTVKGNGEGEGNKGNHQGWTFEDCPKPPRIAAQSAEAKMSDRQKRLLGIEKKKK
jgi:hypothetical protein